MIVSDVIEKTERLLRVIHADGLDGILINAQHNFAWLTGGGCNGVDLSRENGVASLLVAADGRRFLLTNNIEMPRMLAEEIDAAQFEPVQFSWVDEKSSASFVIDKARSLIGNNVATDIPMHASAPAIEGKIAPCRYQLTSNEQQRYRGLGRDAASAFSRTITSINPGETEIEIATKLRYELGQSGLAPVVTLVAADKRIARFRHPVATYNRWEKSLMLVSCSKRDGLVVSLTRIICLGDIPAELTEKTEDTAYVNSHLAASTRPGATSNQLFAVAESAYAERGFPGEIQLHHQGGAIGYRTREWVANPAGADVVQSNQAFAWNPSITGTKVEDTIIVGEASVEVLTTSAEFPVISHTIDGVEYSSAGILSV